MKIEDDEKKGKKSKNNKKEMLIISNFLTKPPKWHLLFSIVCEKLLSLHHQHECFIKKPLVVKVFKNLVFFFLFSSSSSLYMNLYICIEVNGKSLFILISFLTFPSVLFLIINKYYGTGMINLVHLTFLVQLNIQKYTNTPIDCKVQLIAGIIAFL